MKLWLAFLFSFGLGLGVLSWNSQAQAACERSYLYLLLDTQGGMATRRTYALTIIKQLVNSFQSKVYFGLATFDDVYQMRVPISASAASAIVYTVDSFSFNKNNRRTGQAIYQSGLYLSGLKAQEPTSTKNRPYYLVIITGGSPLGDTRNAQTEARNLWTTYGIKTFIIHISGFSDAFLNTVAKEGQTGSAYMIKDSSEIGNVVNAIGNIATQEVCDDLDNNCDGQTDENWPDKGKSCTAGVGGCVQQGTYVCAPDKTSVICSVQGSTAKPEICNNKDDDCNGKIDENLTQTCKTACGTGTETCSAGAWVNCTAPQPKTELCNEKDDNCDGQIDENWLDKNRSCKAGKGICERTGFWQCKSDGSGIECNAQPGPVQTEICDDLDNNCDGQTDENWPDKGKSCTVGVDDCAQQGTYVCAPDKKSLICAVTGGTAKPETCNNKDDDCNGKIDDGLTQSCQTACGSGVETCQAGKWVNCTARQPAEEQCNDQDDDCDGKVDEGLTRVCQTKCGTGKETCVRGRWSSCDAPQPEPEICDGKDNDCDGQIDNSVTRICACGGGIEICTNGTWGACSVPSPQPEICSDKENTTTEPSEQMETTEPSNAPELSSSPDANTGDAPNATFGEDNPGGNPNQTNTPDTPTQVPGCACHLHPTPLPFLSLSLFLFSLFTLRRRA